MSADRTVLTEVRSLLREILDDRPNLLDGTHSCRRCAALVLNENQDRHDRWHEQHKAQHEDHFAGRRRST